MRRLSLLLLVSAATISVQANILVNGGGPNLATGEIAPLPPTPPPLNLIGTGSIQSTGSTGSTGGTLTLSGGGPNLNLADNLLDGTLTIDGVHFGTNLLLAGGGVLYPVPGTLSLEADPSVPTFHPQFVTVTGGTINTDSVFFDAQDLPEAVDFEPYRITVDPIIIVDPIVEPYLPPLTFIVTDSSFDGSVVLGFDQVTGNWQVRRAITDEIVPLPMISYSDLLGEGEIGPAVMLNLQANGLSDDGSTVIGIHPNGSAFRYRSDERQRLELLDNGANGALWTSSWAVQQSFNGDVVVGQVLASDSQRWQAVRWNIDGDLTVLNPLDSPHNHVAKLVTPDGSVIAGDVSDVGEGRTGLVPFIWSELKGFRQLGDPTASDEQVVAMRLSDDGLMLSGVRGTATGPSREWFWTEEGGFQDIILVICDFGGLPVEDYTLTGVDLERGIYLGTFEDGTQFLNFDGVSISTTEWMASIPEPVETLSGALGFGAQAMEGAHHRPISQLAIPGKNSFAWFTGDIGKATKERDAQQVSGEVGYGLRLTPTSVLGVAFGYADLDQDFANGNGQSSGSFVVADLGFALAGGETTLTALVGGNNVTTIRNGSTGETDATTYSLRARHDLAAVAKLGQTDIRPFVSVTFDHAKMDGYAETGGVAPAIFNARSQDSWIGRLGASGKVSLGKATDLTTTLEVAHVLGDNRPDFTGTDVVTGLLDFAMPDVRGRETWGRLGLDLDHQLAPDTVLSLTFHGSTRGDTFDVAGAINIRKGF